MKNSTLLHIPHASTYIPRKYLSSFDPTKIKHEIDVMTDWFCDDLFGCERDQIIFPISRLVCDVERFRDDKDEIMALLGMGVTYRSASDLSVLRNVTDQEREDILRLYYDPHHRKFSEAVRIKLREFGHCLIIDCHSFCPIALPYELDQHSDRPDFCIGTTEYHTPAGVADNMVHYLSDNGFRVKINSPFSGTIVPMQFYEKDKRVFSVMIEVNRDLYSDRPGVKSHRFSAIQSTIKTCIEIAENSLF